MGLAGMAGAGGGRCRALLLICLAAQSLLPAAADVQRRDGKLGSATDPGFLEDHHASAGDDNINSLQTRGRSRVSTRSSCTAYTDDSCPSGDRVKRGPDWEWGNEDGGDDHGTVTGVASSARWCRVTWNNDNSNSYRVGRDGAHDLCLVSASGSAGNAPAGSDTLTRRGAHGTVTTVCEAGKYLASPSATSCTDCPAGTYSRGVLPFLPLTVKERERERVCVCVCVCLCMYVRVCAREIGACALVCVSTYTYL